MIFRNLDENHDWTFGKGKNNYKKENEAIALNIKTRILSWLNDCFFAQDKGIDWVNRLGSKNQKTLLELDLKKAILNSVDVIGLTKISISLEDRNFSAEYTVNTKFSTINDTVVLGV